MLAKRRSANGVEPAHQQSAFIMSMNLVVSRDLSRNSGGLELFVKLS